MEVSDNLYTFDIIHIPTKYKQAIEKLYVKINTKWSKISNTKFHESH